MKFCFFSDGSPPCSATFADNFNVQNAVVAQGHEAEAYLIPALHYDWILHCTDTATMLESRRERVVL